MNKLAWLPVLLLGSLAIASETGPLILDTDIEVKSGQSYRIESFGNLELSLLATQKNRSGKQENLVVVEGPFKAPHFGDDVEPGKGKLLAFWRVSHKQPGTILSRAVLKDAGVYRILPRADITLRSQCTKNCSRPVMTPTAILHYLRAAKSSDGKTLLDKFRDQARNLLEQQIADVELREKVIGHVHEAIDQGTLEVEQRAALVPPFTKFPVKLRPHLPGVEGRRKPNLQLVQGKDLFEFLGPCDIDREELPTELAPGKIPDLRYGHYLDQSLTKCEIAHSRRLADLLTSLASGNGSSVTVETSGTKRSLRTPREVLEYLLADHEIKMQNERTFADFFALAINGHNSVWPLWLDTGIPMTKEKNYQVPMGHSQHAWYISGPKVRARFAFFLGMAGTGFFPLTERRPNWTGLRALYKYSSKVPVERERLLKAISLTPDYYQYNALKVKNAMLPFFGYTYLGVCNDTTALFEWVIQKTETTYPLMRVKELVEDEDEPESLRAGFAALPHDADIPIEALEKDANIQRQVLKRVTLMIPFEKLSGLDQVDPNLRVEMRKAIQFVGK